MRAIGKHIADLPKEKTILECANDGCQHCGYLVGYLDLDRIPNRGTLFASQINAAIALAPQPCKQNLITYAHSIARISVR